MVRDCGFGSTSERAAGVRVRVLLLLLLLRQGRPVVHPIDGLVLHAAHLLEAGVGVGIDINQPGDNFGPARLNAAVRRWRPVLQDDIDVALRLQLEVGVYVLSATNMFNSSTYYML